MKMALTLTIVIPVYNEEGYLKACLDAIANQTVKPDEVIVVDNNSTDQSVKVAKGYKFVKVLSENRQHQVFAQATGFNAAKSDIIGRIDADSILPPDWIKNVKSYFSSHPETDAVTGSAYPYDMFFRRGSKFILDTYYKISGWWAGHTMLYGANFAMRRNAWQKIKNEVFFRPDIWEDYDTSLCLGHHGKIKLLYGIEVETSFRAVHHNLIYQVRYQFRAVRTFALRDGYFKASLGKPVCFLSVCLSRPVRFLPSFYTKKVRY
jgi:glycosyltransferase involved in cell wall biosynthesis